MSGAILIAVFGACLLFLGLAPSIDTNMARWLDAAFIAVGAFMLALSCIINP